ncbi:nuclear transport factor 2 family protein [Bradyrhizobium sp. U87765 SZCCT0131]|uniref:nuclear transport factor 2 family protein n=1 Tax=unclassified Bradyrhizobium TaxID=2631580 RepID=UPI001BA82809|nr:MULTISPECIES: nuclear transport factor 2 family protein [unclassified Bradyrhizobium]MBR1223168.1 nuclear transport factor 2 family protein [Bradyrhizobium sp. U87765 SZCCT0131]MBR1265746.1 nuclear transport factor 2 family protein [Bradyrhizobium sp. U87765 SZCCT0134]MBR1309283.1 nuclear transport factor 2 family protein [Bradyrhizobium sp. U87765 SZCCT0110]MBR1323138.1 nuclear transport factor 2 family protein [Bradyrhizobium sp. U87765 SZCCT0109]MBR1350919.1 nuclear transport factor 2 fa
MSTSTESSPDYDRLMRANLARVFSERDAGRRIAAIRELYAEDAVLHEPDHSATGPAAIDAAVSALLSRLPPDYAFTASGPAIGHHGVGRLRWQAGPPNGPVAAAGMDIAHIQDGRIHSLHVFLEPAA